MKQTRLLKTLLAAVCLFVGTSSVWGATTLYEKGTTGHTWATADLEDWNFVGGSNTGQEISTGGYFRLYKNSPDNNTQEYTSTHSLTTTGGNIVKMNLLWNVESANGSSNAGCYVKFGDVTLFWCGQDRNLKITIGDTETALISGGNSNLRGTDFNVEISINQATKDVNYSISNSLYNSGNPINGSGTSVSGDVSSVIFGWWRGGQRNASAQVVKSLVITEEPLTVATPTFTLGSYNYEEGGYAVTPSCTTEGATLTYTIAGGSATACTSGVPFYAKGGKLNITASKEGWTSSSLASDNQWALNAAPSSSSPETLIPFQTSSDDGDKNIEHTYKSVTIAGGSSGVIAGIVSGAPTDLKLRTGQSNNTMTLNVNPGYTITKVSISAKSNNKSATIDLSSTTIDGGDNIMAETTTFPISTATKAVEYVSGTINAKNNIVFTFDNSNIDGTTDKKNKQILATIKVWYKSPVDYAIEDCKTYETSDEFATAIDAESFSTVAQVYAFQSAWQIAKANASGSTDYSKAIMNKTFELHNTNGWTIYGDPATGETTDDNKYGIVEYGEGWSQYYTGYNGRNVSQSIATLPAGTYRLTAKVYSWGDGAPVRLFANGQLANAENGVDHDPVLDFTVTGSEPSIKIGIGGTGNENDTDNTWGTWGYRVKDFTLTKISSSVTVTSAGWATLYTPYALDFSGVEGLTAYTATLEGTKVTLTPVENVPANTGVVLEGSEGNYNIPVITNSGTSKGALQGNATNATAFNAVDGFTLYILTLVDNDKVQFNPCISGEIAAGKAYLPVSKTQGAKALSVSFANDPTGIANVNATEAVQPVKRIVNRQLVIEKDGKRYNAIGTEY